MRFFHLRAKDRQGRILPRGGLTIGYEWVGKEKLCLSFARCSKKDVWNRKRAIAICSGRFALGKFMEVEVPEGTDKYNILLEEARKYEENHRHSFI